MKINEFIKKARERMGLTESYMASELGLTIFCYHAYEEGLLVPTKDHLNKICDILGITEKEMNDCEQNIEFIIVDDICEEDRNEVMNMIEIIKRKEH